MALIVANCQGDTLVAMAMWKVTGVYKAIIR